jgi:hypothetical protein
MKQLIKQITKFLTKEHIITLDRGFFTEVSIWRLIKGVIQIILILVLGITSMTFMIYALYELFS